MRRNEAVPVGAGVESLVPGHAMDGAIDVAVADDVATGVVPLV